MRLQFLYVKKHSLNSSIKQNIQAIKHNKWYECIWWLWLLNAFIVYIQCCYDIEMLIAFMWWKWAASTTNYEIRQRFDSKMHDWQWCRLLCDCTTNILDIILCTFRYHSSYFLFSSRALILFSVHILPSLEIGAPLGAIINRWLNCSQQKKIEQTIPYIRNKIHHCWNWILKTKFNCKIMAACILNSRNECAQKNKWYITTIIRLHREREKEREINKF